MRAWMVELREGLGLTLPEMAVRARLGSARLLVLLEREDAVTFPSMAAQIGMAYGMTDAQVRAIAKETSGMWRYQDPMRGVVMERCALLVRANDYTVPPGCRPLSVKEAKKKARSRAHVKEEKTVTATRLNRCEQCGAMLYGAERCDCERPSVPQCPYYADTRQTSGSWTIVCRCNGKEYRREIGCASLLEQVRGRQCHGNPGECPLYQAFEEDEHGRLR